MSKPSNNWLNMNELDIEWLEVWIDISSYYVLFLIKRKLHNDLLVFDKDFVFDKDNQLAEFSTYDDAKNWLLEDEFTLVKGRIGPST
jgi:hypothetical protein